VARSNGVRRETDLGGKEDVGQNRAAAKETNASGDLECVRVCYFTMFEVEG
jgi:hypothetical protein